MVEITATVTTITEMVRGRIEAVPINAILGQTTLNSGRHLFNQIADFVSYFSTTEWEGKHGFLPLVLVETKIRLAAGNQDLDCGRIKNPELLNPKIEDNTKGRKILQFQEYHKFN